MSLGVLIEAHHNSEQTAAQTTRRARMMGGCPCTHTHMGWMLCGQKFLGTSTSSLSMLKEYSCGSFPTPFAVGLVAVSLCYEIFALLSTWRIGSAGAFCIIKDRESPLLRKTLPPAELAPRAVGVRTLPPSEEAAAGGNVSHQPDAGTDIKSEELLCARRCHMMGFCGAIR